MNIEELNTQLEYLGETKGLIKQAIINKGQDIGENDTFRSFVQKINDIETGVETANIPIWYSEAGIGTGEPIEYEIENKTPINAWVMDKTTQLTRVDDYNAIRTIPEVGDLYIAISGFLRDSATEYYICLYQIEEVTESGNELNLVVIPLVGERQDNFCTAIGLNTNVLKSGTTILGVQGKSTIVDTEEDNNAATANDIVSGKIAYVNGQQVVGSIDNTPNSVQVQDYPDDTKVTVQQYSSDTTELLAFSGRYDGLKRIVDTSHDVLVSAEVSKVANYIGLTANKLKKNETILGITGTLEEGIDTSDATAVASDMAEGKTAYVNGQKITGSLQPVDSTHPAQNIDPINVTGHTMMMSNIFILQATCDTSGVGALILKDNDPIYIAVQEPVLAGLISLTAGKIKSGETILGITGTYSDTMKEYASETAMNNDIANIQEGEVVKVVVTSGIAGDVDNPLTTTTTHYIKETTMKKLVKEEDTI